MKDNSFFQAALKVLEKISKTIDNSPVDVNAYIAGGIAVAYWLEGMRKSLDLDVLFSHTLILSEPPFADVDGERVIYDGNFSPSMALIEPDYPDRATFITKFGKLNVFVLSPEDIVISKCSRLSDKDSEDIVRLADEGYLQHIEKISKLMTEAKSYYIGDLDNIQYNMDKVLRIIQYRHDMKAQQSESAGPTP